MRRLAHFAQICINCGALQAGGWVSVGPLQVWAQLPKSSKTPPCHLLQFASLVLIAAILRILNLCLLSSYMDTMCYAFDAF